MSDVRSAAEIRLEIERELGGFPPLFLPALEVPAVLEALWQGMRGAYFRNPTPTVLKEKLCARLSRHCHAGYALVLHCCELNAAGVSGAEIFGLLQAPAPANEADLALLLEHVAPGKLIVDGWPGPGDDAEGLLLRCSEIPFLMPAAADSARREQRRLLGPVRYSHWAALLVYLKSIHAWTEAHPHLLPDTDPRVSGRLELLEAEEPRLAAYFRHYADAYRRISPSLGFRLQVETTRRKRAVRDLDRFFKLSPDMFCIAGFDGFLRRANPAVERITGFSSAELMATPMVDFLHPEDRSAAQTELVRLAAGHPVTAFEARFRCKDGSLRWILWNAISLPNEQTMYAAGRDITDRRAAEVLLKAKVAAEEANRAKSRFLANVSHELRTPLNSVIGFANILLKNKESRMATQEIAYLTKVRDNGNHLLRLIDRILDLSRIEAGRADVYRRSISLEAMVRDTVERLSEAARRVGRELRIEIPEGLTPLETDAVKLSQVLQYLLAHALRDAVGGAVTVRVAAEAATGRPLRLEILNPGAHIPTERQGTLFDAFTTPSSATPGANGGAGLELTLCRALCALMGYRVQVGSEPSRGSVFSVHFASAADEAVASVTAGKFIDSPIALP